MQRSCTILLLMLALLPALNCEVFIDYGVGGEGRELLKYFYDVYDEFYIDIGAYDSIFASNTLNLYTQGWGGINIDASPTRLTPFYMLRPDQTNLNYAVGDLDTFVTLYELTEDSSSTVSVEVKQYVASYKQVTAEVKVPSITMKQLCERYYYRKPIFLTLDIEGYGSKALQSNDWANPNCIPEIIFSEINEETVQSKLELPSSILAKQGYVKQPYNVGLNEIYIHKSVVQKYKKKSKEAEKYIQTLRIENINALTSQLMMKAFVSPYYRNLHYDPKGDQFWYVFVKNLAVVDLDAINEKSNIYAGGPVNRPIVIFHFHIKNNAMIASNVSEVEKIDVGSSKFWNFTARRTDGKTYQIFVLDHEYNNTKDLQLKIIKTSQHYPLETKKQFDANFTSKFTANIQAPLETSVVEQQTGNISELLDNINKQIQAERQNMERLDNSSISTYASLKQTFVKAVDTELAILKEMRNTMFETVKQLPVKDSNRNKEKLSKLETVQRSVENLKAFQLMTLILIALMGVSIFVSICMLRKGKCKEKAKPKRRIEVEGEENEQDAEIQSD